jgi:hypothetical protein
MTEQSYSCPSCGAPLKIENRFSRLVVCIYCNTSSHVQQGGLAPIGETAQLAPAQSVFEVGKQGTLHYRYEGGFWDEWFLSLSGDRYGWLQEDEGNLTLYEKERLKSSVPPYDDITVGSTIEVNSQQVFVCEKSEAFIGGGSGELFFDFSPGELIRCVDGNSGGKLVSIEFGADEIGLSVGEEVGRTEIIFQ